MTNRIAASTRIFLLASVTAVLLSCPSSLMGDSGNAGKPLRVRLGREFSLRVGQQAAVDGGRFRVRFGAVKNDSRCPVDVTCVWAGNAEVMIETEANGNRSSLKLNTNGGAKFPNVGKHRRYTVELISLQPQPRQSSANAVTHYVATLVIRKK